MRTARAPLALLLTLLSLLTAIPVATAYGEQPDRRLLYRTHVDAAHVAWENGGLALKILDGQTPIDPASVHVRLGPDATPDGREVSRIRVPDDARYAFLGRQGEAKWNAPATLHPEWAPLWAGFGTGEFPVEVMRQIYPETVRLELVSVSGPGSVEVWSGSAASGAPQRMFSSTDTSLRVQRMPPGYHGHFNWTFGAPGRYALTWRALADARDGTTLSSPPVAVSWYVGTDEQVGLAPGSTRGTPITAPVDATPSPSPTASGDPTRSPSPTASATRTPTPSATASASPRATTQPSQHDFTAGRVCTLHDTAPVSVAATWDGHFDDDGYPNAPELSVTDPAGRKLAPRASIVGVRDASRETPAVLDVTAVPHGPLFESEFSWWEVTTPPGATVSLGKVGGPAELTADGAYKDKVRFSSASALRDRTLRFSHPGLYAIEWAHMIHAKDLLPNGETAQNYDTVLVWYAVGDDAIARACGGTAAPSATPTPTATPSAAGTPMPSATATPSGTPSATAAPTSTPTLATDQVTISQGHVDIFHVEATGRGGGLSLDLRESDGSATITRRPADVRLHVKKEAWADLPAGYPGAPAAYVLPLTQDPALLWPGWETTGVAAAGIREVDLVVSGVTGPGQVHVFSSGVFGGVAPVLKDGGTALPGTVHAPFPAHTHANWVFTKPGTYRFTVEAKATKDGRQLSSGRHTYTWIVGDDATAAPSVTPSGSPTVTPTASGSSTATATSSLPAAPSTSPAASGPPSDSPSPTAMQQPTEPVAPGQGTPRPPASEVCHALPESSPSATGGTASSRPAAATAQGQRRSVITDGHLDLGVRLDNGRLVAALKDDRTQPARWIDPSSAVIALGDKARNKAPAGMEFVAAPGSDVWLIASTQVDGVPWLGQNTMHPSIIEGTTGPVTWRLDDVKGPGKFAVFTSGMFGGGVGQRLFDNVGGPRSHTVRANTHAHPNWVFSARGEYEVRITQTAATRSGGRVSATTTLRFAVGVPASTAGAVVAGSGSSAPAPAAPRAGRTASGQPCIMPSLPGAGADGGLLTAPLVTPADGVPAAQGMLAIGAALAVLAWCALRRRRAVES